jgi:hypothetical protein
MNKAELVSYFSNRGFKLYIASEAYDIFYKLIKNRRIYVTISENNTLIEKEPKL